MFIATYIYRNSNEVFMGKVSIFNYLTVALTSLKPSVKRYHLAIKPINFAENHFHNVQCFPKNYKHYSYLSADSRYSSVRWVPLHNLRYYLESKEYLTDWVEDRIF